MDPSQFAAAGFLVNLVLGLIMWFMKNTYTELKETLRDVRSELSHVKENYYKKEDFREFKDELWNRLDRMEIHWREQMNELRKQ